MKISIATWNINSVRLRLSIVVKLLEESAPDILCLQEIKCPNGEFPEKDLRKLGYEHIAVHGQSAYHGVATISRLPFASVSRRQFCGKDDARHVAVSVEGNGRNISIHNFYVPAGGDEPDPAVNEKFAHKLQFLQEMTRWFSDARAHGEHMILLGDFNIAPSENDVWSHKQLLKVVSHTPVEVELLHALRRSRDWVDCVRRHIPEPQQLYTWWSYRARDWRQSDKGRRLDHIWTTPALGHACSSMQVLKDARDWQKPSDHVPLIATYEL